MHFKTSLIIARKELLQAGRDWQTILLGIVLPFVFLSLLGGFAYRQVSRTANSQTAPVLRIGATEEDVSRYTELAWNWFRGSTFWTTDPAELKKLGQRLQSGISGSDDSLAVVLESKEQFLHWCKQVAVNQRSLASQHANNAISPTPRERDLFQVLVFGLGDIHWIPVNETVSKDPISEAKTALENRSMDLYIFSKSRVQKPGERVASPLEWTLLHDAGKPQSIRSKFCVSEFLRICSTSHASPATIEDEIDVSPTTSFPAGFRLLLDSMSMYISLTLLILVMKNVFAFAAEFVTRERTELTLEPLLITRTDRLSIAIGKYVATVAASLLGAAFSVACVWIVMQLMLSDTLLPHFGLAESLKIIILLNLLFLPLVLAGAGFAIAVGFASQTVKVANSLNGVVMWSIIALGVVLFPGAAPLNGWSASFPMLGSLLMIKNLTIGEFNWGFFALSMISSSMIAAMGLGLTVYLSNCESILYEE